MNINELTEIPNEIFLGISQNAVYPSNENSYSPDEVFPEYPFGKNTISSENQVYRLLREGFFALGYDLSNYGKNNWNPLGEYIKTGDSVLIKPNWVMHYNKNKTQENNLECLVTHPSIVRAVVDYVYIALKDTGNILVADAPMQGCDLNKLLSIAGYLDLITFYSSKGVKIEYLDLRHRRVTTSKGVITGIKLVNSKEEEINVELGERSYHANDKSNKYKVSDYTADKTRQYHQDKTHTYSINKKVLSADFIINIPKPKSHRLSGITAAQKNIVGITFDKASLPHRKIGSLEESGDEYRNKSTIKKLINYFEEKKLFLTDMRMVHAAYILQVFIVILYYMVKIFVKDKSMIGSWHGNDTIWRTVADLNYILRYADKNGQLYNQPKRIVLNVADMIIAGQGNGPIAPHPKELGLLLISEDASYMDALCSRIMGYETKKIPGLMEIMKNSKLSYGGTKKIYSNSPKYHNVMFEEFIPDIDWRFDPHEMWKGYIENYD